MLYVNILSVFGRCTMKIETIRQVLFVQSRVPVHELTKNVKFFSGPDALNTYRNVGHVSANERSSSSVVQTGNATLHPVFL
jgi:hypothetical protein